MAQELRKIEAIYNKAACIAVAVVLQFIKSRDVTSHLKGVYITPRVFFPGNLHKWSFAPRGCAILWVKPKFHDIVDPLLVSWLHDQGLQDRFFQQGTLDYTSYTSVPAAIQFYQEIGGLVG